VPVGELEEPAHTALLKVRALRTQMEEAKEGCEQSADRLAKWSETLKTDREALHDAVEELGKATEAKAQQLADNLTEADAALAEIAAECAGAGSQGRQLLDAEAEADVQLTHHLDEMGPRITALADAAETASREALERAGTIADALEEATQGLEEMLTSFASVLEEMTTEVENTGIAIRSLLEGRAPTILAEKEKEFEQKTGEIRALIDGVFPDMKNHADTVVTYSVDKLETMIDEVVDVLELEERTLEADLKELSGVATEKETALDSAGDGLTERMRNNVTGAETLEQALQDTRGRWVLFGFSV
jgi:DNA repair exonuclease SbcCD ATPase subunit